MQYVSGRLALQAALFFITAFVLEAQPPDKLAEKSHQAKILMAEGRFAEAVPFYQELTKALPANIGLQLNLGLAYHMSGRHSESIPYFERVLKVQPANPPALLSLGAARLELRQPAEAVRPLEKFVALQPADVTARGMLANALLELERAKQAAPHFRKLASLTPDDAKAWYGLGRSYELLAQQAFAELDKTAQGTPEWLTMLADSRLERRQYRAAFYFYGQAVEKKPDFRPALKGIAEVYRRTGHPDWASEQEKREAALPRVSCVKDKAACDFAAGRLIQASQTASPYWRARAYNELALQAFAELGKLPESVEQHALKAEILTGHGQYLEAVQEWYAAERLAPGDPQIKREIAAALFYASDYEKAVPALSERLRDEPDAADLHFFLGDSLLRLEQPEKALPELETAVKLDPALLPARASLGLAYIRLNRPAEAAPHLEAALPVDDDGNLHYQLARAAQGAGEAEKARKLLQKYQEIRKRSEEQKELLEETAQITPP